ncbi:MAG: DUF4127 family protein, partial [Candidatus Eremiobacteraeota bacterium]|nr:DUF4127 family protein [Candidatus Eremiobacteraeota bacterium]
MPLDDRPATAQFPLLTSAICGAQLATPPASMLGHFSNAGDGDALARWLLDLDTTGVSAVVVSADMLAYGGLVGSRTAATPLATARARVAALARFHEMHPAVPLYVFATIMRLASTETPRTEAYLEALTDYARNAGATPRSAAQNDALTAWRGQIPDDAFWDYIGARARDLDIDETLVRMAESGDLQWLAITQDDAGAPDGLQISDQRALNDEIRALRVGARVIVAP